MYRPSDVERVSAKVVVHAVEVTYAKVCHRHSENGLLHDSRGENPHQTQTQGTLYDKMHYLPTTDVLTTMKTYVPRQIITQHNEMSA